MTGKYDDWKSTEIIIYVIGTSIEPAAERYIYSIGRMFSSDFMFNEVGQLNAKRIR